MPSSDHTIAEVFLQPGEFFFGDRHHRVRTVLGSCVAITLWHPGLHVGGMCHFMLPSRRRLPDVPLDGRFGEEAIALFLQAIGRHRSRPVDYEVKVFGGGNMFPGTGPRTEFTDVGARNVALAREQLTEHGFRISSQHLEGNGHRNVVFDIWSGDVWLKHQELVQPLKKRGNSL